MSALLRSPYPQSYSQTLESIWLSNPILGFPAENSWAETVWAQICAPKLDLRGYFEAIAANIHSSPRTHFLLDLILPISLSCNVWALESLVPKTVVPIRNLANPLAFSWTCNFCTRSVLLMPFTVFSSSKCNWFSQPLKNILKTGHF